MNEMVMEVKLDKPVLSSVETEVQCIEPSAER